jgi:hypothetical protein
MKLRGFSGEFYAVSHVVILDNKLPILDGATYAWLRSHARRRSHNETYLQRMNRLE